VEGKDRMRTFSRESFGIFKIFFYPKSLKEVIWTVELVFLRLYLWFTIYRDINIRKKKFVDIWLRVESTK